MLPGCLLDLTERIPANTQHHHSWVWQAKQNVAFLQGIPSMHRVWCHTDKLPTLLIDNCLSTGITTT